VALRSNGAFYGHPGTGAVSVYFDDPWGTRLEITTWLPDWTQAPLTAAKSANRAVENSMMSSVAAPALKSVITSASPADLLLVPRSQERAALVSELERLDVSDRDGVMAAFVYPRLYRLIGMAAGSGTRGSAGGHALEPQARFTAIPRDGIRRG
jgi:hypothetical protein